MKKQKRINLADLGIIPGTEEDFTEKINKIIEQNDEPCTYVFQKGIYRFFASKGTQAKYSLCNTDRNTYRTLTLQIKNKKNITFDGNGSKFLFAGNTQPITLDSSANICLKNFTIDWEKPLVAEGIVFAKTPDYLDLRIDQTLFPCFVSNFCLNFDIGDNETSMLIFAGHTIYDGNSLSVARNTADSLFFSSVEKISKDIFRLYTANRLSNDLAISIGDIVVLRHGKRLHAAVFAENCEFLKLNNIKIHSAPGIGILFQFCHGIHLDQLSIHPNQNLGRMVSCTRDDGIQAVNCRGSILIENCNFFGLQDSPVNIHGSNITVDNQASPNSLIGSGKRPHFLWAKPNDRISIVNNLSYETVYTAEVEQYAVYDDDACVVSFKKPIASLPYNNRHYSLENADNTPAVTIRNCHFGSCRARGLLVCTPKPVLIEENYFESSGSAILLHGDYSTYYESGACRDVTIRKNIFTDLCCLSQYENCLAVVNISPQVSRPMLTAPYHQNITIEDNVFSSPGTPIIYAFDAGNLSFCRNKIFRSGRIATLTDRPLYLFAVCSDLLFKDNTEIGQFHAPTIRKITCTSRKESNNNDQ